MELIRTLKYSLVQNHDLGKEPPIQKPARARQLKAMSGNRMISGEDGIDHWYVIPKAVGSSLSTEPLFHAAGAEPL